MEVEQAPSISSTKWAAYLDTVRTVGLAENHHFVGVNELLYPRFELILPGVVLDGRHFCELFPSACAGQAWIDGWLANEGKPEIKPHQLSLSKCTNVSRYSLAECSWTAGLTSAPLPRLTAANEPTAPNVFYPDTVPCRAALGALDHSRRVYRIVRCSSFTTERTPPARSTSCFKAYPPTNTSRGCLFTCRKSTKLLLSRNIVLKSKAFN